MIRLAVALILLAGPVASQAAFCGMREAIIAKLQNGYGERFHGGGLRNETRVLEVWVSKESGTWTILMTDANGRTCVMASGTAWRQGVMSEPDQPL